MEHASLLQSCLAPADFSSLPQRISLSQPMPNIQSSSFYFTPDYHADWAANRRQRALVHWVFSHLIKSHHAPTAS